MADNEKKIEKLEKSCYETAKKELKELKKENEDVYLNKINEMIDEYKIALDQKYRKEYDKLKREFNKEVFDYEIEEKVKINEFKNTLISNMKNKIEIAMYNFINTNEYEVFLINNIENSLKKIKNNENSVIFLTEKDMYKFQEKIKEKFGFSVQPIDNGNIGGSIVRNDIEKILVNNTIKNNIEEKIKKITF